MKYLRNTASLRLAFISQTHEKYFADVHAGLRNFCDSTEGVRLVHFQATTRLNLNALNYAPVDGVVGLFPDQPAAVSLSGRVIPTINVSHARRRPAVPSVINDDLAVGELAAGFLIRAGTRYPACLTAPEPWQYLERAVGFRRAVRRTGKTCTSLVMKYPSAPDRGDYTGYFKELQ